MNIEISLSTMSLLTGELPARPSLVTDSNSCPLTGKRATSCAELGEKPVTSELHDRRSRGTCEYFRQRENSSDVEKDDHGVGEVHGISSTTFAPILPPSRPVKIGKHELDIKHCCVSPCNNAVSNQLRGLMLKETFGQLDQLEMNAGEDAIIDLEKSGKVRSSCDQPRDGHSNELSAVSDCDATGSHKKRSVNSTMALTSGCRGNRSCADTSEEIPCKPKDKCDVEKTSNCENVKKTACGNSVEKTPKNPDGMCDANNNGGGDIASQCGLLRSLDAVPVIDSLPALVEELHRIFEDDHVNVDYVEAVMRAYKSAPAEWRKYSKFDKYKYTRNLVDAGNDKFNLMILCWGEGHGSSVHDHADAHCFMKMLDGALTETRYAWPSSQRDSEQPLQAIGKAQLKLNDVCYINDSLGLHRVENSSYADKAVSLHLYSPPFNACSVFNERTGHKTISRVTFWSKFGKRDKKQTDLTEENQVQEIEDN